MSERACRHAPSSWRGVLALAWLVGVGAVVCCDGVVTVAAVRSVLATTTCLLAAVCSCWLRCLGRRCRCRGRCRCRCRGRGGGRCRGRGGGRGCFIVVVVV